jgi:hypothetical protein
MLSIIIKDDKLHNRLFPGPGITQEDGTGSNKLLKSEFEWMIASGLFGDGQYVDLFTQLTMTPAGWMQWTMKIKNRLTQQGMSSFHLFHINLTHHFVIVLAMSPHSFPFP